MLSIRRRQGPYAFGEALAPGRPGHGWPGWVELGPILLRSAGIVGIAGVIMVIAAGDALFTGPDGPIRDPSAVAANPGGDAPATPKPVTVIAVKEPPAEGPAAPPQSASQQELAFAPFAPPTDADATLRGRFGDLSPRTFTSIPEQRTGGATAAAPVVEKGDLPAAASPVSMSNAAAAEPVVSDASAPAAAEEAALEPAGPAARVPVPRPDPPPVRRTRSARLDNKWPDQPPPNCGSKHAYWHYTDRKARTKAWYCR